MKPKLKVASFSAGVSSFVAAHLAKDVDKIIYIDIDDQHPDSLRFVKDCEDRLNKPIEILKSPLGSVDNAIKHAGFIRFVKGEAACTKLLKKRVRREWEAKYGDYDITYVWGLDCDERDRQQGFVNASPDTQHEFTLIDRSLTKQDCHGICAKLGIKRPAMYDLGYNNNNCIGCIKGGEGYWNKIRIDFPDRFRQRAEMERIIGRSCINGVFLDELDPKAGRMSKEIMQDCSMFCEIETQEVNHD